jgi:hypothetical protein
VIVIKSNCNRRAHKSNHPIQNPLLLVTESRSHNNMYYNLVSCFVGNIFKHINICLKFQRSADIYEELTFSIVYSVSIDTINRNVLRMCVTRFQTIKIRNSCPLDIM